MRVIVRTAPNEFKVLGARGKYTLNLYIGGSKFRFSATETESVNSNTKHKT
jgi:hypothetical protein